jgi:hypothetical protein
MRQLREHPFFLLLAALLLLVLVYPALHEASGSRVIYNAIRTVVLLAAIRVLFSKPGQLYSLVGLAVVLIVAVWIGYLLPERRHLPIVLVFHILATLFFVVAIGSILWKVYLKREVSADSVAGALCAYMVLGVVFAHCYWFIEIAAPGSFRGEGEFADELRDPDRSLFALTYYSFATITSLGTSEITPARWAARGMTVLEAICGQFYIAVLIADLIGKRVSKPPNDSNPPSE